VIALDTNVLVRLLAADDPPQVERAKRAISRENGLIPTTVLLEASWVLDSRFGYGRATIAAGLRRILGLPGVDAVEPARVQRALTWFEQGLDLADALHVATAGSAVAFVTFDERLMQRGRALGVTPPPRLP
jgi:predicted nucleic acid-binding protein